MSGHLCLKWNNHSSAFLKSISNIQVKERYCDATIVCQGKYFPVHRIILSTCSDYFDEIFERIQCQHPYIVFKDIEPREMELLLNYMYQGEVNVVQEMLPTLIKAAEALRVKGLAVPDDLPSSKDSSGKKRSNQSNDNPQPKRRSEDSSKKRRGDSSDLNTHSENAVQTSETQNYQGCDSEGNLSERVSFHSEHQQTDNQQSKIIKEEPLDPGEYDSGTLPTDCTVPSESQPINKEENIFVNFPVPDDSSSYIKTEDNLPNEQPFEHEQTSTWTDFASTDVVQSIPPAEMGIQSDIGVIGLTKGLFSWQPATTLPERSRKFLSGVHVPEKMQTVTGKRRRKRCVMCYKTGKRRDTPIICSTCPKQPALCITPCFTLFHNSVKI